MNLRPVTVWEQLEKDDKGIWRFEHNHLEDGHCPNKTPTPKIDITTGKPFPHQMKAWPKGTWLKTFKHLTQDCKVI